MRINSLAEELGYRMPMLDKGYSLEQVQDKLRAEGPSAFLRIMRLQEDISPKASPKTAQEFVAERLNRIGPTSDLIIVDPYLFPQTPSLGIKAYAKYVAQLIAPLLTPKAVVTCVVNKQTGTQVVEAVRQELGLLKPGMTLSLIQTEDFHDRFWIANRSEGVVVGASLNNLGKRIFFIDSLTASDVGSVMDELAAIGI